MRQCKMCEMRGQTWEGSAPKCAFPYGTFMAENWNCATMNALREIVEDGERGLVNWEDENCAAIPYEGETSQGFIVMTWYKRRGQTGRAMLMCDDSAPIPITEEMALEAIAYHRRLAQEKAP